MGKKEWKTADEVVAELNSNPEFLKKQAERKKRRQEREKRFEAVALPIMQKLEMAGYPVESLDKLAHTYQPLPDPVVALLLESIEASTDLVLLEWLIRPLAAAPQPFDGRPLIRCYERVTDWNLQWVIANTIACAKPHSIDEWIEQALRDPQLGKTLRDLGYR